MFDLRKAAKHNEKIGPGKHCWIAKLEVERAALDRMLSTAEPKLTAAVPSVPNVRRRGPTAKYNWPRAMAKLREWLEEDGAPADGDGGQAKPEKRVATLFPPDDCPSESTTREKVRKAITDYRRSLSGGQEGQ